MMTGKIFLTKDKQLPTFTGSVTNIILMVVEIIGIEIQH
jgi:hypothetical protein